MTNTKIDNTAFFLLTFLKFLDLASRYTYRGRSSSLATWAWRIRTCLWLSLSASLLTYLGVKSKPTFNKNRKKMRGWKTWMKTNKDYVQRMSWQKKKFTSPIATRWSLYCSMIGKAASRSCIYDKINCLFHNHESHKWSTDSATWWVLLVVDLTT